MNNVYSSLCPSREWWANKEFATPVWTLPLMSIKNGHFYLGFIELIYISRKAVRATLILIPLLGLQYILLPFRPENNPQLLEIYLHVSAFFTAFQVWHLPGVIQINMLLWCLGYELHEYIHKSAPYFSLHTSNHRGLLVCIEKYGKMRFG